MSNVQSYKTILNPLGVIQKRQNHVSLRDLVKFGLQKSQYILFATVYSCT